LVKRRACKIILPCAHAQRQEHHPRSIATTASPALFVYGTNWARTPPAFDDDATKRSLESHAPGAARIACTSYQSILREQATARIQSPAHRDPCRAARGEWTRKLPARREYGPFSLPSPAPPRCLASSQLSIGVLSMLSPSSPCPVHVSCCCSRLRGSPHTRGCTVRLAPRALVLPATSPSCRLGCIPFR
jgi:hypothetical protein